MMYLIILLQLDGEKKMEKSKEVFLSLPVNWSQIDPANPMTEPDKPVKSNETVIGTLTDRQKMLWATMKYISTTYKKVYGIDAPDKFTDAHELIKELLYFSINEQFDRHKDDNNSSIGIRINWQIVTYDNNHILFRVLTA